MKKRQTFFQYVFAWWGMHLVFAIVTLGFTAPMSLVAFGIRAIMWFGIRENERSKQDIQKEHDRNGDKR